MRQDRRAAVKLRRSGKSYGEISASLGVPRATLSRWLASIRLSERSRKRIRARTSQKSIAGLVRRNKNLTQLALNRASEARKRAADEVGAIAKRDLLTAGALLYWLQGYKRPILKQGREATHHPVSFASSDPGLVKLFLRFLREHCGVPNEKIKANVSISSNQNEQLTLQNWQFETKIPMENFSRPRIVASRSNAGKRPFHRLEKGVLQVHVASTPLYHRIMGYIEGLKKFV